MGILESDLKEREVKSETGNRNKSEAFHDKDEKVQKVINKNIRVT